MEVPFFRTCFRCGISRNINNTAVCCDCQRCFCWSCSSDYVLMCYSCNKYSCVGCLGKETNDKPVLCRNFECHKSLPYQWVLQHKDDYHRIIGSYKID